MSDRTSQAHAVTPDAHTAHEVEAPTSGPQRIAAGALAGIAAGIGMFLTLAMFAVGKGDGFWYPLKAVHAMMSGRRVLPEFRRSVYGSQSLDFVIEPVFFLIPAVTVGLMTAALMLRRARARGSSAPWWMAAPTAAILTVAFFVVFIVVLGYNEAVPSVQRNSSGQGVRELGLLAWIVAHIVYTALLVALLDPVARAISAFRNRRRDRAPES